MPTFSLQLIHPALVHFPIALLVVASATGLAYIHWRRTQSLHTVTWWAMIGGWLALIPAILSGLVAQGGLAPDAPFRQTLNFHTTGGFLLLVVYGNLLYRGWLHHKPRRPQKGKPPSPEAGIPFLERPSQKWLLSAELILGAILVFLTGMWGGELVYTWGVGVR